MSALLASELLRMWSRRLVRTVAALGALGIVVAAAIVAVRSRPEVGADPRFPLLLLPDILKGTSIPLIIAAWLLGASFIGADWHAGTVATLLAWEPRRVRVILTKAVACVAVVFAVAVVLQTLLSVVLAVVAAVRGTTEGVDGAWLRETAGVGVRTAAMSSIAAVIGFAVASIGRNTAAALGAGFAYLAVIENLVRGLRPQWQPWLMSDNAAVFITGSGGFPFERTLVEADAILGVYAAALLVVGVVMFRTRDVN